uniref:Uncharacterized protein n=1 Tax=Spumella elongata TaxID=89044 RepID=A0A7S3H2L7_9STRA|mmetsp:Transcript_31906/g.54536  ORF Transcript_31906/g.54536 Transcript_31906/m.54536 type:complete len:127 (+) Transcript_31906:120-500(+)
MSPHRVKFTGIVQDNSDANFWDFKITDVENVLESEIEIKYAKKKGEVGDEDVLVNVLAIHKDAAITFSVAETALTKMKLVHCESSGKESWEPWDFKSPDHRDVGRVHQYKVHKSHSPDFLGDVEAV